MSEVNALPSQLIARLRALLTILLGALLLCGALVWGLENARFVPWLSHIPWLRVDEVKITCDWPLTSAVVREWLPKLEGENILNVRPSDLIASLEGKPWVDTVTIKKEYPNRILIDVGTKRAMAIEILKNQPWFLDDKGNPIEKARPSLIRALDLPVVSVDKEDHTPWQIGEMLPVLSRIAKALEPTHRISELALGTYPQFRIFLGPVRTEVIFSLENWESQLPRLLLLLRSPPTQIPPPARINLLFSRKALVSSTLSN